MNDSPTGSVSVGTKGGYFDGNHPLSLKWKIPRLFQCYPSPLLLADLAHPMIK